MRYAGPGFCGRTSSRLAALFVPPYYGRCFLARLNQNGYISPSAEIHHSKVVYGKNVFIGDRVVIFGQADDEAIELGDGVHLYGDTYIETGQGGTVKFGRDTHILPNCQFSAYKGSIEIGSDVQIAPGCAFYPYDHGTLPGDLMRRQPLITKGDITIEDDVWLGFGVIVLSGVRIGRGAVIGAGSVVTKNIPDGAIAAGMPARVLRMRNKAVRLEGNDVKHGPV